MKMIEQPSVDLAFSQKAVRKVTVIRREEKEWYFTFEADDPVTGRPVTYAMLTQRGKLRTWADPRNLFEFLKDRGVSSGMFNLEEDSSNESNGNDEAQS